MGDNPGCLGEQAATRRAKTLIRRIFDSLGAQSLGKAALVAIAQEQRVHTQKTARCVPGSGDAMAAARSGPSEPSGSTNAVP